MSDKDCNSVSGTSLCIDWWCEQRHVCVCVCEGSPECLLIAVCEQGGHRPRLRPTPCGCRRKWKAYLTVCQETVSSGDCQVSGRARSRREPSAVWCRRAGMEGGLWLGSWGEIMWCPELCGGDCERGRACGELGFPVRWIEESTVQALLSLKDWVSFLYLKRIGQ